MEAWQIEDASRLRAAFVRRAKMSQEKFGQTYNIGSQGAVWQYLDGRIPLNLPVALKFAEGLGVPISEISPTLAQMLRPNVARDSAISEYQTVAAARTKIPFISWTAASGWPENKAESTGEERGGWVATSAEVGGDAFALRVVGDANEPRIQEGSIIIIDPARKPRHGSWVLVKRAVDADVVLRQLWYDGAVAWLRPWNTRYPILDMPADTKIIGVAVRAELDLEPD